MNAVISCSLQDFAKILQKATTYTKSEPLKEKLDLSKNNQEMIRECLEDDNYFTIQHMLNLTATQLGTVLKAVSHLIQANVNSIAFVNEFDSDGAAYAMVHLSTTINLK